jgi:hypothetical protein
MRRFIVVIANKDNPPHPSDLPQNQSNVSCSDEVTR